MTRSRLAVAFLFVVALVQAPPIQTAVAAQAPAIVDAVLETS